MKVTYRLLKEWVGESDFAKSHNMAVSSWNGYYYVLSENREIVCAGKSPSECWREFCLYRAGYLLKEEELKCGK